MNDQLRLFLWCVRQNPKIPKALAKQLNLTLAPEVSRRLCALYSELALLDLTDDDMRGGGRSHIQAIASKVGLEEEHLDLPLLLFEQFCQNQRQLEARDAAAFSRDEIVEALTHGGRIPLKCVFLFRGQISVWDPSSHLHVLLIENNQLFRVCRRFLQDSGACYESLDEVRAAAQQQQWPNYEALIQNQART